MRIWLKEWSANRLKASATYEDHGPDTRTHKVFAALEQGCRELDLAVPLWLDSTVREFQQHSRCRFYPDAFIEEIDFDYLELHVLEEDW